MNFIFGNIVMFAASVLMMIAGLPKNKKICIILQTIQIFASAFGNLLLGSFPGFFVNCCSGSRNLLYYFNKLNWWTKVVLIIVSVSISIIFNNVGWLIICPIISFVVFTLTLETDSIVLFKLVVILGNILWLIHDIYIHSYAAAIFDILATFTNLVGIYRVYKDKCLTKK